MDNTKVTKLDQFVLTVRSLSSSNNREQLDNYLSKQSEMLHNNVSNLDTVLEALDVHENSVSVLTVLSVKASVRQKPFGISTDEYHTAIAKQINDFCTEVSEEKLRGLAELLYDVMESMLTNLGEIKKSMIAIPIIKRAICKLQEKPYQLTQMHCLFCQACLMSKNLKPALSLLDQDIYILGNGELGVEFDMKFFLHYYYLGGNIYTMMKNYSKAITFFEIAMTTLLPNMSEILVESFKKYVLVSIIHSGCLHTHPKLSQPFIDRELNPECQAYLDLIPAYQSGDLAELQRTINKYHKVYLRETNFSLVKQVVKAFHRKNILKVANAFLKISISDLAQKVLLSTEKAEELLISMIESGEIHGKINCERGSITFSDPPKRYEDPSALQTILDEVTNKISFSCKVQQLDQAISVNPLFIKNTSSEDDGLGSKDQSSSNSYQEV